MEIIFSISSLNRMRSKMTIVNHCTMVFLYNGNYHHLHKDSPTLLLLQCDIDHLHPMGHSCVIYIIILNDGVLLFQWWSWNRWTCTWVRSATYNCTRHPSQGRHVERHVKELALLRLQFAQFHNSQDNANSCTRQGLVQDIIFIELMRLLAKRSTNCAEINVVTR